MPIPDRDNPSLPTNVICVGLFSHGNGKDFHCSMIVPVGNNLAVELQAINGNRGQDGWVFKPWSFEARHTNVARSLSASVIVIIGMSLGMQ